MNFKKSLLIALFSFGIAQSAFAEFDQEKFDRALQFHEQQNYAAAFPLFKPFAEQGSVQAQFYIGMMYRNGRGVVQNHKQAVYWLKKAAEQGLGEAQMVLGLLYLTGEGVRLDKSKAKHYLDLACYKDISQACKLYADSEREGVRLDKSKSKAKHYLLDCDKGISTICKL